MDPLLKIWDILNNLTNKVETIAQKLPFMEEKLENMSNKIQFLCDQLPRTPDNVSANVRKMKQKKTKRNLETYASKDPFSNEQGDDFHVEVLKDKHKHLMENITLQDNALDLLVQNKAIYPSDSEAIMSFSNRSERVRCLLLRLAKYDETHFMHFTDALQQEKRKDLANILIEGYNEYKNRKTERTPKCTHCKIKSRVELKDVIDKLYQERVIDESFVDRVNRSTPCARKVLWNECFYIIKKCDRAEVLSQCLKERYEHYVTTGTYFKCTCLKQRLHTHGDTGGHFNSPSLTSGSMADWSESPVDSLSPASTFRFRNVHADTISSLSSVNSSTHRKSGSVMSKRLHQTKKVDNDSHLKFYKKGRKYKKVQEIFETKRSDNSESERINQNPLVSEMSREEILHLQTETLDSTYL